MPRGRARIGAIALVVVLLAAVAVAMAVATMPGLTALSPRPSASPSAPLGTSSLRPAPTATARPPSAPPPGTSAPTPGAGNAVLDGSPELVFFQRQGDDLNVLGWRAGERELGVRQVLAGAVRGMTSQQQSYLAQLSPDGSTALVQISPKTFEAPITFRAFRLAGNPARMTWESTALGSEVSGAFVGPETVIVTAPGLLTTGRPWTLVDLATEPAGIKELDAPPIPQPTPGSSIDFDKVTLNNVPLASSADGRYLYALSLHGAEPLYRPAYRIDIATGKAERVAAFPTSGPSRVLSSSIDPATGRMVLAGARATAGSGRVEAWAPGANAPDFSTDLHNVFGAAWVDDGSLITADYSQLPGPFTFRVLTLTGAGEPGRTLFTADGTNAALVGARGGFAAAYVTSRGSGMRTLVMIRLADGAISMTDVEEPPDIGSTFGLRP